MNFLESLDYLYKNRVSDKDFCNSFSLYCALSDLCVSTYEDRRKAEIFYKVNKKVNMVQAVYDKDESVVSKYNEVADLLSENSYLTLLESLKSVMYPGYQPTPKPKASIKKDTTPKTTEQKTPVAKAVVTRSSEPEEEETRTPLTPMTNYSNSSGVDVDRVIGLSVIGGVLLAILFILFACVLHWPWAVWQWFVGIVGGLVLSAIFVVIVYWLHDESFIDYFVLGPFVLGACIVINFILLLIFKSNYGVIFGCFSVLEILFGGLFGIICYADVEKAAGFVAIEIIIALILFIVKLIWI